jgi:hypothetical protein
MGVSCVKTSRTFLLKSPVTTMCAPVRGTTFEEVQARLRRELDARGGNMRQLARDVATDGNTESARRLLYRILRDGSTPEPETSALLEAGLGRPAGYFTVARPSKESRQDRLAGLEARVQRQEVSIAALLETVRVLHGEVKALGGDVPDLPDTIAEPRPGAEGTRT